MHPGVRFQAIVAVATLVLLSTAAQAKRVIFLTSDNDVTWQEGYYRQNPQPGDVFVREADGKTLQDALDQLADGDELIIGAHGGPGVLRIGGGKKGGFRCGQTGGTGSCYQPYVIQPSSASGITVTLNVCFSDSTAPGLLESVLGSLEQCLRGDNVTLKGKKTEVMGGLTFNWNGTGTEAQRKNALRCLADAAVAAGFMANDPQRVNKWVRSLTYAQLQQIQTAAFFASCGRDIDSWLPVITFKPLQKPELLALPAGVRLAQDDYVDPDEVTDVTVSLCEDGSCPTGTRQTTWGQLRRTYR
jgi:hypothetical protein